MAGREDWIRRQEAKLARLRQVREGALALANARTVEQFLGGVRALAGAGLSQLDEEIAEMEAHMAEERGG